MKANLNQINQMVLGKKLGQMDQLMKENLREVENMVKVAINGIKAVFIMENGRII